MVLQSSVKNKILERSTVCKWSTKMTFIVSKNYFLIFNYRGTIYCSSSILQEHKMTFEKDGFLKKIKKDEKEALPDGADNNSLWLQELFRNKSMQHGLHPEDESDLLEQLENHKSSYYKTKRILEPQEPLESKSNLPTVSLSSLLNSRSLLPHNKTNKGGEKEVEYYIEILKKMNI